MFSTSPGEPSTNPKKDPITKEQEEPVPMDLYWTFSQNKEESYHEDEWVVNPESEGSNAGATLKGFRWFAKGDQEQGEVQLLMTPDGSRFYGIWLDEGEEGSDIVFRRIMSGDFAANVAQETASTSTNETTQVTESAADETGSSEDDTDDGGGDNS